MVVLLIANVYIFLRDGDDPEEIRRRLMAGRRRRAKESQETSVRDELAFAHVPTVAEADPDEPHAYRLRALPGSSPVLPIFTDEALLPAEPGEQQPRRREQ